ncbi:serine/threonine-protein kinase [Embleya scabrispora]|uniref:serine/threonine-protein kinase n=1 Tax=Embleya scabrispora TaxID=159449 RepID=UPI001374B899|nr:serine/threonine-protein kinase [Embleya scabrispora]
MRSGMRIGRRYRLTKGPISGGMGEVWVAHDEELNRRVALKRVRAGDVGAEAGAQAKFTHPRVVTMHDVFREKRLWGRAESWLVMEYVDGGSLDRRAPMSPQLAAHIGGQIAEALEALHAQGLLHCDIKPANVVDAGGGSVKVTDFGAVYRFDGMSVTPRGQSGFTLGFAAPEVLDGKPPTPRSDVFSLGATMYALVAGAPPGRRGPGAGNVAKDTAASSLSGEPSEASECSESCEEDPFVAARRATHGRIEMTARVGPLQDLLEAMLRKDWRQRPDLGEVRRALAEVAGDPRELPTLPARETEPSSPPTDPPVWWKGAVARTSAVLLAAVVATVMAIDTWPISSGSSTETGTSRTPIARPVGTPAATPNGSTAAQSASRNEPISVIGDHRTVDPCALTDASAFQRFGRTELDRDYGSFARCDVILSANDTETVDIEILFTSTPAANPVPATRTTGRVRVTPQPAESRNCDRLLTVDGVRDTTIVVEAKLLETVGAPLCEIADVATEVAVDRLNRGELARRSPRPPENSLLYRDACAMLDAKALGVVPGIDARNPDTAFGGWGCDWRSTTDDIQVGLRFDRPELPDAADGRVVKLDGRQSIVLPDDDGKGTCTVEVTGPTYSDQSGKKAVELVSIAVGGNGPTNRSCDLAQALARSAALRIPPG